MTFPTKIIPFRRPSHAKSQVSASDQEIYSRFSRERDRPGLPLHMQTKEKPDGRTL